MTESKFKGCFSEYGNEAERYENGSCLKIYTLHRGINNDFNMSYHLKFPQKKIQFNFWYEKESYINSTPKVIVSFFNGNETDKYKKLKNIFQTANHQELKSKIEEIFKQNS